MMIRVKPKITKAVALRVWGSWLSGCPWNLVFEQFHVRDWGHLFGGNWPLAASSWGDSLIAMWKSDVHWAVAENKRWGIESLKQLKETIYNLYINFAAWRLVVLWISIFSFLLFVLFSAVGLFKCLAAIVLYLLAWFDRLLALPVWSVTICLGISMSIDFYSVTCLASGKMPFAVFTGQAFRRESTDTWPKMHGNQPYLHDVHLFRDHSGSYASDIWLTCWNMFWVGLF